MRGVNYFRRIFYETPISRIKAGQSKPGRVFNDLFSERFAALNEAVQQECKPDEVILRPAVYKDFCRSLWSRLRQLLEPALEENYQNFAGVQEFFAEYGYLEQAARQAIDDWDTDVRRFLQRLTQDLEELRGAAGLQPKPRDTTIVRRVRCDLSDRHAGGKTVKIVETSAGTFVYKPRSLKPEVRFYKWLNFLNQNGLRPNLYTPWVIDKGAYGWMEYCRPLTSLNSAAPARRYARQYGTLSAVWYLLGGTDLHRDNMLFSEQGAIIIDCETIFEADLHYYAWPTNKVMQRVEPDASFNSIISTSAFSHFLEDETKIKDIGGAASYASLMKRAPRQPLALETFVNIVCQSVAVAFKYFRRTSAAAMTQAISAHFDDVPCRVLLRPTRHYSILLHNLTYTFEALGQRADATAYLREQLDLLPPAKYQDLVDPSATKRSEVSQMLGSDTPYFTRALGKNRLHLLGELADSTKQGMDFTSVRQRLQWLQEPQFIQNEIDLVRLNLSPGTELKRYARADPGAHNFTRYYRHSWSFRDYLPGKAEDSVRRALSAIAARVMADLKRMNDTSRAYQLCSVPGHPKSFQPMPTAYSLFSGVSGSLLFLGAYAAASGDPSVTRFVRQQAAYFLELAGNAAYVSKHREGLDMGCQSLLYMFEQLHRLGILAAYPSKPANEIMTVSAAAVYSHQLVDGVSGNALLAYVVRRQLAPGRISGWAEQLKATMHTLLAERTGPDENNTGLALGALGACLAASKLYRLAQDEELKRLARSLALAEKTLAAKQAAAAHGWCTGAAGSALAYHHMGRSFDLPHLLREARAMTDFAIKPTFTNHTLCCGSLGFAAAHLHIRKEDAGYQDKSHRLKMLYEFYKTPGRLLTTRGTSSVIMPANLFYGLSGLGTVFLYYLEPKDMPAPWAVE